MDTLTRLLDAKIVAIFRGDFGGQWLSYAEALRDNGVTAMEITLNSPGALDGIRLLNDKLGDSLLIGAGTVLTAEAVDAAAEAGATFIVAPDTDEAVITASLARGLVPVPGAYTATEIRLAHKLGAPLIKLFPATAPDYIKAIRAPLNHIPLMATGGVDLSNAADFMKAGASALGIGSSLLSPGLRPEQVGSRAAAFVDAVLGRQRA